MGQNYDVVKYLNLTPDQTGNFLVVKDPEKKDGEPLTDDYSSRSVTYGAPFMLEDDMQEIFDRASDIDSQTIELSASQRLFLTNKFGNQVNNPCAQKGDKGEMLGGKTSIGALRQSFGILPGMHIKTLLQFAPLPGGTQMCVNLIFAAPQKPEGYVPPTGG
jgi:hypothetical protein